MVSALNKGDDITGEVVVFLLSVFIIQLIFMTLGALISAIMRKPKASGSISSGILFGAYVISKITDLTDHVNGLNVLSPFKYFNYEDIVYKNTLSPSIVALSILLVVIFSALTYFFYMRRDLNV
jgi:ABC-2 type transport system permease protein